MGFVLFCLGADTQIQITAFTEPVLDVIFRKRHGEWLPFSPHSLFYLAVGTEGKSLHSRHSPACPDGTFLKPAGNGPVWPIWKSLSKKKKNAEMTSRRHLYFPKKENTTAVPKSQTTLFCQRGGGEKAGASAKPSGHG